MLRLEDSQLVHSEFFYSKSLKLCCKPFLKEKFLKFSKFYFHFSTIFIILGTRTCFVNIYFLKTFIYCSLILVAYFTSCQALYPSSVFFFSITHTKPVCSCVSCLKGRAEKKQQIQKKRLMTWHLGKIMQKRIFVTYFFFVFIF